MWTAENRSKYNRDKLRYPSDLTDEEWRHVEPLIPPREAWRMPPRSERAEVLNGIMYVPSTGCQWRYIPQDLPPKSTVFHLCMMWRMSKSTKLVCMCNRYEQRGSAAQIRKLAEFLRRMLYTTPATDNLRPQDNIYPDQDAPIITNKADGGLELTMAQWGFPPIPGETAPITNIRNLKSKWWRDANREWITAKEYRCLVPFIAFAAPVCDSTWFKVPGVEVATFASIWRPWKGKRLAEQPGQKRRNSTPLFVLP